MRLSVLTMLSVFLWVAISMEACSPEGEANSLYVVGNQLVGKKTQCIAKATGGTLDLNAMGVMDLTGTNTYWLFPMVINRWEELSKTTGLDSPQGYLNPHVVLIKGAWVSFKMDGLLGPYDATERGKDGLPLNPTDLSALGEVWVPTSGSVDPGTASPLKIMAVPPFVGNMLDKDIAFNKVYSGGILTVTVVIEGVQIDGSEVHSMPFHFPIMVCRQCLVVYDVPPERSHLKSEPATAIPCFPGQDEPTSSTLAFRNLWGVDRCEAKRAMILNWIQDLGEWDSFLAQHPEALKIVRDEDVYETAP